MGSLFTLVQSVVSVEAIVLMTLFAAVALFVTGIAGILNREDPVTRRLNLQHQQDAGQGDVSIRVDQDLPGLMKIFEPIEKKLTPQKPEEASALRLRLARAGFRHPKAPLVYFGVRLLLAAAVLLAALVVIPLSGVQLDPLRVILFSTLISGVGFYGPVLWVSRRISKRRQNFRAGLPDALDMLLVCVEAGLSLGAALDRVSREIGRAHPVLSEELVEVARTIQAGRSREDALREFATRLGLDEVRSFVGMLIQSEALGTSISQGLRVHADDLRKKRFMRAEEKANRLPVAMALPLGFFVLPCLMIVVMTPIAIRVIRILFPALN